MLISLEIQRINEHRTQKTTQNTQPGSCSEPGQEFLFDSGQTKPAEACRPNCHENGASASALPQLRGLSSDPRGQSFDTLPGVSEQTESPPLWTGIPKATSIPQLEGDVVQQSQETSHPSPLSSHHHKNHLWLCLRPCAHLSHSSVSHPKSKLQFHVTLNDFYSSLRFYSMKNPMRLHYLGHLPTG